MTMLAPALVVGRSVRSQVLASFGHPLATASMLQVGDILAAPKALAQVRQLGISSLFHCPQKTILDSGGFQWLTQGRPPLKEADLVEFYNAAKADFSISLDRPLPILTNTRKTREIVDANIARFGRMRRSVNTSVVVPVLHGYTPQLIERQCFQLIKIERTPQLIALGGTVPLLIELTRNFKNGKDRKRKMAIASALVQRTLLVRQAFPRSRIHLLGAGGPVSMALAMASGAHSTDSAGWRVRAAFGCILMPFGRQVRGIAQNPASRTRLLRTMKICWVCRCPTCRKRRSHSWRATELGNSFAARATHNLYQQFVDIECVKEFLASPNPELTTLADHPLSAILEYLKLARSSVEGCHPCLQ